VILGPIITKLVPSPIVVGTSFVIQGSSFTAGSVVNFFVATSRGTINPGPFTPISHSPTQLTVDVPPDTPLGQGFVGVQVVNKDQGGLESNLAFALLEGSPAAGIPNLKTINGIGLAPTSSDPRYGTDNVTTVVPQGTTVNLGGTGFDTANGVAVDLFCACPPLNKVGPFFLHPGNPGLVNAGLIKLFVPAKGSAGSPRTGPGSFVVSNRGLNGKYSKKSNAVSVPIGAKISVTKVTQALSKITVDGTGFSTLTVINFFNKQGAIVKNLGGLMAGKPKIPISFVNETQFTFSVPVGALAGPSYVQAINPPFVPFTSSDNDPGGAFTLH
jgi:hypothetical protein